MLDPIDAVFIIGMLASLSIALAGFGFIVRDIKANRVREQRNAKRRIAYRFNIETQQRYNYLLNNDKQTNDELNDIKNNYYKRPIHELLKARG